MDPADASAGHREEAAELAEATRALMLAASTTDVDIATMRAAREQMDELTHVLGTRTRPRVLRVPFDGPRRSRRAGPDQPWPLHAYNPQGLPFDVHFDGDAAWARVVPDALLEGPPDSLHGGFGAHLMDCMLGILVQARGTPARTATLELRYLRRTPLDVPLDLHSRIVETRGRRITAEGWVEHQGERTVEAHGLFIEVPPATGDDTHPQEPTAGTASR